LKILWLAHRDIKNPRAGGAERYVYEVSKRLVKEGYDITVIAPSFKGGKSFELINGIKVLRYRTNFGPHLVLPFHILTRKYDCIINDLGHVVPWPTAPLFSKNNIVMFHHLHARTLPGQVNPLLATILSKIEKLYPLIYKRAIFVTVSSTSREDLINLGIDERKIKLIPPGVNKELFKPRIKTSYPSMVYFAGIRKYKRPEEALLLLNQVISEFPNAKLYVINTGSEIERLNELSHELKLENNTIFTGKLSDEKLAEIVGSSWLNVYTSVSEGFGLSIIEASASGTPTVAYNVPGVADAIEDGLNGIKVKTREELVKVAIKILKDPEPWWKNSLKVAEKYSWERTTELWKSLLNKLI